MRIARAALAYFALVFGAGFVFGTVRVLVVVPRIGERAAELIEAPIMVLVSWLAARWITRQFPTVRGSGPGLAVGFIALGFLLAFEVALGILLRGVSIAEALAKQDPFRAVAYYGALLLFALMPRLVSGPADGAVPQRSSRKGATR